MSFFFWRFWLFEQDLLMVSSWLEKGDFGESNKVWQWLRSRSRNLVQGAYVDSTSRRCLRRCVSLLPCSPLAHPQGTIPKPWPKSSYPPWIRATLSPTGSSWASACRQWCWNWSHVGHCSTDPTSPCQWRRWGSTMAPVGPRSGELIFASVERVVPDRWLFLARPIRPLVSHQ